MVSWLQSLAPRGGTVKGKAPAPGAEWVFSLQPVRVADATGPARIPARARKGIAIIRRRHYSAMTSSVMSVAASDFSSTFSMVFSMVFPAFSSIFMT